MRGLTFGGALAVVALSVAGCAEPEVTTVQGPSGAEISTARCTRESDQCMAKAAEVCAGGPYQVIESYRNAGGVAADVLPGPVTWYTLRFQCGPSDGRMPAFPLRGPQPAMPEPVIMPAASVPAASTITTCDRIGNSVTCRSH